MYMYIHISWPSMYICLINTYVSLIIPFFYSTTLIIYYMLLLTYKCKIPNLILFCIHVNNRVYLFPLAYNKYFSLTVFTVSDTFFL